MKTVADVKSKIDDILNKCNDIKKSKDYNRVDAKKVKTLLKGIDLMRSCILYLETNPSEVFIASERDRISKKIILISNGFPDMNPDVFSNKEINKRRKEYEKTLELPKLKSQLKVLNFLLK